MSRCIEKKQIKRNQVWVISVTSTSNYAEGKIFEHRFVRYCKMQQRSVADIAVRISIFNSFFIKDSLAKYWLFMGILQKLC